MNEDSNRSSIISDLVKVDRYRSHLNNADKFFSNADYADVSMEDLKKIHDIYTRYLLDYKHLREPYPTVIESFEYTNHGITLCITDHKLEMKDDKKSLQ